jgi:hypothetical protein
MPDLLIKLYRLPQSMTFLEEQASQGIILRKPIGNELNAIKSWVFRHFGPDWASEVEQSFRNIPISCFLAQEKDRVIGFACYDSTALGFFGPTGVLKRKRGRGTGKALLLACLHEMHWKGYGYAIIGAAGPVDFYQKVLDAIVIPGSEESIWKGSQGVYGRIIKPGKYHLK